MQKQNKKVLLINPNQMKPPIAPLGLEYVGAYLRKNQVAVHLLDLAWEASPFQALEDHINQSYDLVGISVRNIDDSSFATRDFVLEPIAKLVRFIQKKTRTPVVLGGCGFSLMGQAVLAYCGAPWGIAGDGERSLLKLLHAFANRESPWGIEGLMYRNGHKVTSNPPAWASIPERVQAWRGLVDHKRYFTEGGQAGIETKRGCPHNCIYCADPLAKGTKVRTRDIPQVLDELSYLADLGIGCFHFCDSEFNVGLEHAEELCARLIADRRLNNIIWYAYAAPRPFPARLAKRMRQAGCAGINFGADHGNKKILENLGKDYGPRDITAAVQTASDAGMAVMADLLLGGPGETADTIAQTIQFAKSLPAAAIGANMGIRIYPGTALAALVQKEGFSDQNANLHGVIAGNQTMLKPVFYLSSKAGKGIAQKIGRLVGGDRRFMFMSRAPDSYNYNQNQALVQAIKKGKRGAYWHILSQP